LSILTLKVAKKKSTEKSGEKPEKPVADQKSPEREVAAGPDESEKENFQSEVQGETQ